MPHLSQLHVTHSNLIVWIGALLVAVFLLTQFLQAPGRVLWWVGKGLLVGILFVVAVNWVGGYLHFHLPLNAFTAVTAGFLGVPGVAALIAMHLWLFPA